MWPTRWCKKGVKFIDGDIVRHSYFLSNATAKLEPETSLGDGRPSLL